MHAQVKRAPTSGQSSLAALFQPRSIVIVGASERSRWVGALLDNFERGAYAGELFLVNRRGATVRGRATRQGCHAAPRMTQGSIRLRQMPRIQAFLRSGAGSSTASSPSDDGSGVR